MTFLWSSYKALPQRGFAACTVESQKYNTLIRFLRYTIGVQLSEHSAGRRDLGQCP